MSTIEELQKLSEREDHVEFKKAEHKLHQGRQAARHSIAS